MREEPKRYGFYDFGMEFLYGYMTFVWILVRFCLKIYLDMDF